jgi:ketosteroid isomerase-like protein
VSAATEAVQATLKRYIAACNAGDAGAYVATLAPDVVFCPPAQKPFKGHDAARSWVQEGFFDVFDVSFDASFDRMIETSDEVMAPGSFSLDLTPKGDGDDVHLTGTFFTSSVRSPRASGGTPGWCGTSSSPSASVRLRWPPSRIVRSGGAP